VKLVDISGKRRKYPKNKIRELQTEILDTCVKANEIKIGDWPVTKFA
jgi:hypothetical protein